MVWTSVSPDGTKSVRQNTSPMQGNTTYIETEMNKDHFWDIGVNEDGHHKFAQMPKNETGGLPSDPALAAGMDLVYYSKEKTATESPDQQDVQPYARCGTGIMQLLGIRACVNFTAPGGAITINYAHNITSVVRVSRGTYRIKFTDAMPSANYLAIGTAQFNTSSNIILLTGIKAGNAIHDNKTTDSCIVSFTDTSDSTHDPLEASYVFFGG